MIAKIHFSTSKMYSKIFPLLSKGVYLNTAYVGLMSKALVEFRAKNEKDYLWHHYWWGEEGISGGGNRSFDYTLGWQR